MIDFIDMARARNRDAVEEDVLRKTPRRGPHEDLHRPRSAGLGLVEMTRQNVNQGRARSGASPLLRRSDGRGRHPLAGDDRDRVRAPDARRRRRAPATTRRSSCRSTRAWTAQLTGRGTRALHALEAETGKYFLFEGSEGLPLDHFRDHLPGHCVRRSRSARRPSARATRCWADIVEPGTCTTSTTPYGAQIDGYIILGFPARAPHVGEQGHGAHRRGRAHGCNQRAAAFDESGEVVNRRRCDAHRRARRGASARRREAGRPAADGPGCGRTADAARRLTPRRGGPRGGLTASALARWPSRGRPRARDGRGRGSLARTRPTTMAYNPSLGVAAAEAGGAVPLPTHARPRSGARGAAGPD